MDEAGVLKVLGLIDKTVWVITSSGKGGAGGLAATFVQNASIVAGLPRIVVGIARNHHTWGLIQSSRSFVAHLFTHEHRDLVLRFGITSGRDVNKLAGVRWVPGRTGSPVLADALASLECRVEGEFDIGDRTIFLGDVVDGAVAKSGPALTAERLMESASTDERRRLDEQHLYDEEIARKTIVAWRRRQIGLRSS